MKIEEAIDFFTIEPPKDPTYLYLYSNLGIATYSFEEKIKELSDSNTIFKVSYADFTIKGPTIGTLVFSSAENPARLKSLKFTSVYAHPTIKEIRL